MRLHGRGRRCCCCAPGSKFCCAGDRTKNPFAEYPEDSWFVRTGRVEAGRDVYRRDWRRDNYGAVNQPGPQTGETPLIVHGVTDRGYAWAAVEWACHNPLGNTSQQHAKPALYPQGAGLSANGNSPQIEAARSPLSVTYVQNWCSACVSMASERVDEFQERDRIAENRAAMSTFDWSTLFLASVFLSLAAVGELKDIYLCSVAVDRAAMSIPEETGLSLGKGEARVFKLIGAIRKYTFLPGLIGAISILVTMMGGDALSICLNTIAVLFLFDVDNMAFAYLIDEKLRHKIEVYGRVELVDDDMRRLHRIRYAHAALISPLVIVSVMGGMPSFVAAAPAFLAVWLASCICEIAALRDQEARDVTTAAAARCVLKCTAETFGGLVLFILLISLAYVL